MVKRIRADVRGRVQGVGFRPTVYRYATHWQLSGFVRNTAAGVTLEIQGEAGKVAAFIKELKTAPPPNAKIEALQIQEIAAGEDTDFVIMASQRSGTMETGMPPDLAMCPDCEGELFDSQDRRYQYPFINCTNCGPRFTLIQSLPYDRGHTSMNAFTMCEACQREYTQPGDRRFDAQPNACSVCGPHCRLLDANGKEQSGNPILAAAGLLQQGAVLAVKGIGGYHLACDAKHEEAVKTLRLRKNRPAKALAVMFANLEAIQACCEITPKEIEALLSPARPIVVVKRKKNFPFPELLSPDTNDLGVFLPYSPLHHLLLAQISPLVMTSGNRAEEPIVKDEKELSQILGDIADDALVHNRPIVRRCDDSVLKIVEQVPVFIRRSRGFVPNPIVLPLSGPSVLACGGDLKNTFCVTRKSQAYLSQHVGDLNEKTAHDFYQEQIHDFCKLLDLQPEILAYDTHPDYLSTRFALQAATGEKVAVQHHHAHIAAVMAEHQLSGPVIGVALDGTGYGDDGTIWGGEIFLADFKQYQRAGHFKSYALPGGEQAIRHPERMAYSYLWAETGSEADEWAQAYLTHLSSSDRVLLKQMIEKKIRSPQTSSAGRLFDAVAAILGMGESVSYEGQAAIRLQTAAEHEISEVYDYQIELQGNREIISFGPMLQRIIRERKEKVSIEVMAKKFHNTVVAALGELCQKLSLREKINRVVLSGGVFQNDLLLRLMIKKMRDQGLEVYYPVQAPPNDGGIALGQAAVALARYRTNE